MGYCCLLIIGGILTTLLLLSSFLLFLLKSWTVLNGFILAKKLPGVIFSSFAIPGSYTCWTYELKTFGSDRSLFSVLVVLISMFVDSCADLPSMELYFVLFMTLFPGLYLTYIMLPQTSPLLALSREVTIWLFLFLRLLFCTTLLIGTL